MNGLTLNLFMEVGKWFICLNIPIVFILFILKNPVVFLKIFLRCRIFQLGLSKRKIVTSSGQSFSYIERGKPACSASYLFVHGYSNSKEIFLDIISWLPKDIHIIAVDLPGHGETTYHEDADVSIMYFTEQLNQFVKAVGMDKNGFHVIGESMGGHIAGVYSSLHPCDVKSATLMCPHGIKFDNIEKMKVEYENTGRCILLPENLKEVRDMFDVVLQKKFPFPSFVLDGILQMRLERDSFNHQLLRQLVSPGDEDLLERSLERIKTPTMVVWGRQDKILDVVCLKKIQSKLESLKKAVILENAGHLISVDCPKNVATNILEFTSSY